MAHFLQVCPGSDEVIIITSSLMKDMNSRTDLYRSNAIRVLCSIADSQVLGNIERYFKQASSHGPSPNKPLHLSTPLHNTHPTLTVKQNREIFLDAFQYTQGLTRSKTKFIIMTFCNNALTKDMI